MPLEEAMRTQRAVRRLHPDPVDDEIVLRCIELALKAPTGSNGQNWEFVVVKDQAIKEKLGARYRQAWTLYGGVGRRVGAGATSPWLKILQAVEWQVEHFTELPVLVVACLRGSRVPWSRRRRWPSPPTTARSTRASRTCCWPPGPWGSAPRSSRCRCGAPRRPGPPSASP